MAAFRLPPRRPWIVYDGDYADNPASVGLNGRQAEGSAVANFRRWKNRRQPGQGLRGDIERANPPAVIRPPCKLLSEGLVRLHIHLISDSTGETVTTVARAAVSQFEDVIPVEHVWFFIRSQTQLSKVLTIVEALPGLVLFTLVSPDLRFLLTERCRSLNIPCVPVIDPVMGALSTLVGSAGRPQIGRQHAMDEGYFSRIEAMNFAMRHDDGQCIEELDDADVVLVGVSRTSKTPTCVYLANRGIRTANVPIVTQVDQLSSLERLRRPLVVGLTINPDALVQIRRNRQQMLGLSPGDDSRFGGTYADLDRVREELVYARRLFARLNWPEIDVTKRSVEETAASIYQMLRARHQPELGDLGVTIASPVEAEPA
jgi:[pyruvate, water dikinase]-phosphate phosphotransferase / [pyruvate, water dikinase] kinase